MACEVNPNEPPMPGKVEYEQAKSFTEAFLRGEPHPIATLATVARDKINKLRVLTGRPPLRALSRCRSHPR